MAEPKNLDQYAGQRLYRNSLDDILDQLDQDLQNEQVVAQARQNAIINSEDPVRKLKEVQSIEKSVQNEVPEVQATVLNQTYNIPKPPAPSGFIQPDPNPQFTMGQPRGELQNLTEDDIRFRAELERIQEPFDRIFNEKLKTAKAIPGRSVTDPMSGGSYNISGTTKEEVARNQTIDELVKKGIIDEGQGFRTFLTTAIPLGGLTPEEQAQQQEFYPVRNIIAQLGGTLTGLSGVSKVIKGPKIAQKSYDAVRRGTKIGNFLTKQGINTVKAGKFTASATTGAGTFGAYRAIDQIDEDAPVEDKAKTIVEDAIFGAGFGLTGSLNNPATRALAEGTFGFVSSKLMEGATTQEALLNGLLFAGFGILNKRNMKDVEKGIAINEFKKVGEDSFKVIQDLRKQAGLKPFTKLQEKQWRKSLDQFAERFRYEKYDANDIKRDTEEFITRFLRTNDPKGSIAKIRQIGNQSKTQALQAKAKAKKEAVTVPTTGTADKVTQDNVLRLSTGEQLRRMKGLGYTEDQFVRLSGKERQDILDNNIREENFVTEQPTRPSMPVPGPAPDVTPSTKKSDKLVPEKLEPKPEEVKPESIGVDKEGTGIEEGKGAWEGYHEIFHKGERVGAFPITDTSLKLAVDVLNSIKKRRKKAQTQQQVKPEVQPTKGEATGLKTTSLKPSDIKIDESKFQPREEYNQAIIDDIAKNFDAKKWDEPVLWQDPKTDEYFVVSGHHRHQGVVKGGYGSATYKVLPKGTTIDEAINMSEEGNLARTEQSAFENSKVVRRRFERGDSLVKIADELPGLTKAKSSAGKSNAVRRVLNLSYLDQNGKLKSNYDSVNEFPRIQSTSSYVGALRRQYDWMPDRYEDDVFTYLYTENGIRQDDSDWKLNLESTLEKLVDVKDRPGSILKQLRKDPLQPKEGTSDEILEQIKDLKKSIDNIGSQLSDDKFLQREIDRIQTEKGLTDVDALQEVKRDLRKRRAELKAELKDLVEESSKPDPNQSALFEPVEQYNIFGGVNILPDLSTKDKQILDELHNELANLNREQHLFNQQVAEKKIGKLKARTTQKKLDKRYSDVIKKMQKIDKPVNGATAKPGMVLDINEQLKLDLDGKRQTSLFRETATKKDKESTKELQKELSGSLTRLGITERASSIIAPLEKFGASHFIGKRIGLPGDLANMAQVVRDRRYETFRIFFVNKQSSGFDKIVGHTAYTNRMPGWNSIYSVPELNIDSVSDLSQYMYKAMKDAGADGYYLLHNHPSGNVKPSKEDFDVTEEIIKAIPGFRAHVVINHKKYTLIEQNDWGTNDKPALRANQFPVSLTKENSKHGYFLPDPLVNTKFYEQMPVGGHGKSVFSTSNVAEVMKRFEINDKVVSIFATDYDMRINALTDIPLQNFIDVGKKRKYGLGLGRIKAQLRKIASTYGGQRLFLTAKALDMTGEENEQVFRVWKRLFKDNFITDGFLFLSYEDKLEYKRRFYSVNDKVKMKGTLMFNPGAEMAKVVKEPGITNRNTHLEGFEAKAKADGIELDLSYNKNLNAVKLHLIKIPKDRRNQGIGTRTIRQILDYVDDQGLLMTLTPTNEFGSSKQRLVEFYKSFGFRLNSGPYRDLRFKDTMIRKPFKSLKIKEQVQSLDEIKIQRNFANWFGESKAVDIDGNPEVYYHGTQRPDRIGSVFYKSRAHSGPMSYFTNDPEIASGYAKGKSDDSLIVDDWSSLYSIGREKGLRSAWWQLTDQQKKNFNDKAYKVGLNDDNKVVLDDNYRYISKSTYDYFLKEANGNGLMAVFKAWIEGGYFIGEEKRLLEVFKIAGVSNMKFNDPRAVMPGIFPVYLSMQNPLTTDNIPNKIVEGLRKRSKKQPGPKYMQGTTPWDKESRKPEDWMWALDEDVKNNTSLAWTSIPDWVTRYLKQQGYDGIMDVGGKYNPENPHSVAIPFEPNQVKSKFNRGTFSKKSKNIMKEQEVNLKNPASSLSSIKQLKTKQKEITSTQQFKKWFKGSQVKDKDGKPLVVYHGGYKNINKFNTPSFFSDDSRTAEIFSDDLSGEGEIYPVYLSIKNPYITKDAEMWEKIRDLTQYVNPMQYLKENGIDNPEQYDGLIYESKNGLGNVEVFSNDYSEIVAFNPNQIKSIFNKGTFSKRSKNIMKEQGKIFKNPASTLTSIKQLETKAEVPDKVYDDAKARSVMDIAKERTKELKGPGLISRALTPMSTRLRVLAPELKRAIRRFQSNVDINTSKDLKVAENFMKQTDKLRRKNKQDYAVLDLAMKNSDLKKAEEILTKHNMQDDFFKVREMLDDIYFRAEMVGYEPNYLSDYFPRKIKDSDGLMGYLEASDSWGVIQSNIKSKETELGRRLEKDERLKLINNLIRGFGGRLGIQRPANLKEREIEYLDSELNEFYFDSNTALHKYIVQMNEAIEIKRFFGKGMGPEDPNIQVDNNVIGEYVDTLLDQGIIKSTQQDELINLLRIRFAQGPMDPRMAKTRNTAYLFTMGQLSSAVTQIGDLAWSIYNAGVMETGKSLGKSALGKSILTRKDIGIEKIAQEFTETDKAHKILDTVFTLTGLKYIDSLGKESLINSTIAKYQKQARKGKFSSKFQERLDEAFDKKELPKVIADLKSGEVTDDIKYLAHYILSDFQPVSLTEMPEFYLKAPNGRVMYMLKTYTMKQYDIIRNESFKKMKEGKTVKEKAEGLRRLIYLASVLMLTGMSSDKIKNYLYGREQEFDEMISDNMLRLVGFQKYLLWHFRRYKNVAWTTVKALVPPVGVFNPVFESFIRDLDKYQRTQRKGEEFKIPGDTESVKNIPIVGRLYYNYFGNGEKFHAKRKEKEAKKKPKKRKRDLPM